MRWIRTTIVGTVGLDEGVAHVLNWRHKTIENAPADAAAVKAFGDVVATKFAAFLAAPSHIGGTPIRQTVPNVLTYKEVRTALLDQPAPNAKPVYTVPTQYSLFAAGAGLAGQSASPVLPYEVALVMSLGTGFRGPRFRGRTYLGPLTTQYLGAEGQFGGSVDNLGARFADTFIAPVAAASDYELHVVSLKYGTSARVNQVRTGHTPDSQRRRRRGRAEAYVTFPLPA